ncbi:MAG: hypothetical protein IMZ53_02160 [Thermoplasmata archaeon]|nr:hypothetical protein [Thermoplasmata archaeon]
MAGDGNWNELEPVVGTHAHALYGLIRDNNSGIESAIEAEHIFNGTTTALQTGAHKQGSARCFYQATSPATAVDGSAFASTDLGMIWIDSDDKQIYILTAITPTWTVISTELFATFLAAARVFGSTLSVTGNLTAVADIILTGTRIIRTDTTDGNDTGIVNITAASANSQDRSGEILVCGNQHALYPGEVLLSAGKIAETGTRSTINALTSRIKNLVDPADDQDAATKASAAAQVAALRITPSIITNIFGVWDASSYAKNTAYLAAKDGLVYVNGNSPGYSISFKTDSSNPPTTERFCTSGNAGNGGTLAARKGDYWKIDTDGTITIHWLPIGT